MTLRLNSGYRTSDFNRRGIFYVRHLRAGEDVNLARDGSLILID